jgi:hypothetical protein
MCVPCLSSQYFACLSILMQAVRQIPADSPLPTRFRRSGRLYFLVCLPAHLHHSVCLPVLCCLTPHFGFCYPPPNGPYFRVSWWDQTRFLGFWLHTDSPVKVPPPIVFSASFLLMLTSFKTFADLAFDFLFFRRLP